MHLTDAEYDQTLAENIAFIRLYDASANNTVVECIARATPPAGQPIARRRGVPRPELPLLLRIARRRRGQGDGPRPDPADSPVSAEL